MASKGVPALLVFSLTLFAQPSAPWWKHAVIYEIYPRSFADSNGDGTGDLNGITAHLDYLKDLGVDAIWLTPFYPSPQVDFGYDVSDYRNVDPRYGSLADFDRMVAEAKKRHIRVLIDMVLNHTSNQHPWFVESQSSRTNPKADWYVWRPGRTDGQPPNNWASSLGRSAWDLVPARGQYYYHHYYPEQPDLNWRNAEVREAAFEILRFWLKRGVSGFRLDGIGNLFEDEQFRDEPVPPGNAGENKGGGRRDNASRIYTRNLPETHDAYKMLRKVADEFPGTVLVGQVGSNNAAELASAYGVNGDELHLPINAGFSGFTAVAAAELGRRVQDAETALNGRPPLLVLDSHDRPRSWTRYADGTHDLAIAKLLAAYLLAPRGAALIYYGQELGMENNDPKRIEDVQDPSGKRNWPQNKGRDGERTPMQWNATANAGFSTAKTTWLPVAPSYTQRNVAAENADPNSLLNFYRSLIRLRKQKLSLMEGDFEAINDAGEQVVAWISRSRGEATLVALNVSASPRTLSIKTGSHGLRSAKAATLLTSSRTAQKQVQIDKLALEPYGVFAGLVK